MRNIRFIGFGAALAGAIALAVGTLAAQGPPPQPGRRMMTLDGRGSELGVMVRDLEGDALEATKGAGGVRIDEVNEGSAAQKAGIKAGDIVVEYDGERVRSARQFTRLVQETPEGRTVKIALLRNGQRQTVDATPEARTFSWNMDFDGDRIRRDVERGMREMGRLREFRVEPPAFNFRFDDMAPMPPARRRLGVTVEGLTAQLADYFGAKAGGVLVSGVSKDSPAERAGIKAGDVITSVNGQRVQDPRDVTRQLAGASGNEVSLGIVRDKKETTVKATVEPMRQPAAPHRQVRPAVSGRPA